MFTLVAVSACVVACLPVEEITTEHQVNRRHRGWATWVGTDQLPYARRTSGAALQVRGESWQDLDDAIVMAERRLGEMRPEAWQ